MKASNIRYARNLCITLVAAVIEYGARLLSALPALIGCLILYAFARDVVAQVPAVFLETSNPGLKLGALAIGILWLRLEWQVLNHLKNQSSAIS